MALVALLEDQPLIPIVPWSVYLNTITYIIYSQYFSPLNLPANGYAINNWTLCNIPLQSGPPLTNATGVIVATLLMSYVADNGINATAPYLKFWLDLYNSAFPRCGGAPVPATAACFPLVAIPVTPPSFPGLAPGVNASVVGDPSSICTWEAVAWTNYTYPSTGPCTCNCAVNASVLYSVATPPCCLLQCDPPPPMLVGARPDQCLAPMNCAAYGIELDNATQITTTLGVWLGQLATIAPITNSTPPFPLVDTGPGLLGQYVLAAMLSLYYQQRYRPGQYIYARTVTDGLLSPNCFAPAGGFVSPAEMSLARNLWSGMQIDVVLRVINRLWLGSAMYPAWNCVDMFTPGSADQTMCQRLFGFVTFRDTQSNGGGGNSNYALNSSVYLEPFLQSYLNYQTNCTAQNTCFFTSTFNAQGFVQFEPSLSIANFNFTNPEFYSLVTPPIADQQPCRDTLDCFGTLACGMSLRALNIQADTFLLPGIGQLLLAIPIVISSLAGAFNNAAHQDTSGPQWSSFFGNSIWGVLQDVLEQEFNVACSTVRPPPTPPPYLTPIPPQILDLATFLDCVGCAIAGNIVGNALCLNTIFINLQGPMVLLQTVGDALISFVVDTIEFLFTFFGDVFSGNASGAGTAFTTYITQTVTTVLVPIAKGSSRPPPLVFLSPPHPAHLPGLTNFLFGSICLCVVVNIIPGIGCKNLPSCPGGKKRAATDATNGDTWFMYQTFAPEWPGTPFAWPPGSACAHAMAQFERIGADHLSETQADEAAFCLAQIVLWNMSALAHASSYVPISPASDKTNAQFDPCTYLMKDLVQRPGSWASFPVLDRAKALECIQGRGSVYGWKQAAGGKLDWMPDTLITHAANPFMWLPTIHAIQTGWTVASERINDVYYTDAVLQSGEHQANLHRTHGPGRVALLRMTLDTGSVPVTHEYTNAVLGALHPGYTDAFRTQVTGAAELFQTLYAGVGSGLVLPVMDHVEQSIRTTPPVLSSIRLPNGTILPTPYTAAALDELGGNPNVDPVSVAYTNTHRLVGAEESRPFP